MPPGFDYRRPRARRSSWQRYKQPNVISNACGVGASVSCEFVATGMTIGLTWSTNFSRFLYFDEIA